MNSLKYVDELRVKARWWRPFI